ncbi:hypothetical protein SLS62_004210 [Diatrype stigma]|uniref:Uncharacterized protein n=1 Tax=Diatrype stigma TaxID=117547 RepID=A0AAN9YTM2_9PEZI
MLGYEFQWNDADERLQTRSSYRTTHGKDPRASKDDWNVLPPFHRPRPARRTLLFSSVQPRTGNGKSRRRIRTTVSARLEPSDSLGLSSETPFPTAGPRKASQLATLTRRMPHAAEQSGPSDPGQRRAVWVSRPAEGPKGHSFRKTGIGELWGRRHASCVGTPVSAEQRQERGERASIGEGFGGSEMMQAVSRGKHREQIRFWY